jgi:hypothetical protein
MSLGRQDQRWTTPLPSFTPVDSVWQPSVRSELPGELPEHAEHGKAFTPRLTASTGSSLQALVAVCIEGTQGWLDPRQDLFIILLIQRAGLENADALEELQRLAVEAIR